MIKTFGILGALSELLEPHLFGRTGALKFGAQVVCDLDMILWWIS